MRDEKENCKKKRGEINILVPQISTIKKINLYVHRFASEVEVQWISP
jgi:hypothetical protein